MPHVATLIAPAKEFSLEDSHIKAARQSMEELGAGPIALDWLAPREAADLYFEKGDHAEMREALETLLADQPIDIVVQAQQDRRKKILIADMDSTIIQVECIDELADFAGLKGKVAAITEAAMRGELDFEAALRERVGLLKDMDVAILERCYRERVKLTPGAKTLVATMRANGAYCALVSGGFSFFTSRVAAETGFHLNRANVLEIAEDKLTGNVLPPVSKAETKLETLKALIAEHGLTAHQTLAVGDGANDVPMLEHAGLAVAYYGKPKAMDAAHMRVRNTDLRALLFAQGYKRDAFMEHDR